MKVATKFVKLICVCGNISFLNTPFAMSDSLLVDYCSDCNSFGGNTIE